MDENAFQKDSIKAFLLIFQHWETAGANVRKAFLMRLWTVPAADTTVHTPARLILELDSAELELQVDLLPDGMVAAVWVDSQTGRELAWVPVGEG